MKKQKIPILVLITCIFAAFVFGFFAGRNLNRTPVQIWTLPLASETTAVLSEEIPQETDTESAEAPDSDSASISFPININTATSAQLENLPGIGPVIAQRIVDHRNAYGPFTSPGQLTNVSGVGEKRLAAIWDYITIGD